MSRNPNIVLSEDNVVRLWFADFDYPFRCHCYLKCGMRSFLKGFRLSVCPQDFKWVQHSQRSTTAFAGSGLHGWSIYLLKQPSVLLGRHPANNRGGVLSFGLQHTMGVAKTFHRVAGKHQGVAKVCHGVAGIFHWGCKVKPWKLQIIEAFEQITRWKSKGSSQKTILFGRIFWILG